MRAAKVTPEDIRARLAECSRRRLLPHLCNPSCVWIPRSINSQAWYLVYFASLSCLFPYLNLFFRRLGLNERRIGMLGATRPFISMPAGAIWSGAADKSRRHRAVLLLTLCASVLARLSLALVGSLGFAPLLAMVATTEFFAAPVTIIVDAAVMAACAEQGDYGRQRLWGAVGWGLMAAVSGSAISHTGIVVTFVGHAVLGATALAPTLHLRFGPLHAKLAKQASGSSWERDDTGSYDDSEERQKVQQEPAETAQEAAEAAGMPFKPPSCGSRKVTAVQRFGSALETKSLIAGSPAGSTSEKNVSPIIASAASQHSPEAAGPPPPRVQYWWGVRQLMSSPETAIFMAMAVCMGFGVGNIEGYLFLYLDELGGSELLMGLSLTVTCAAETLVFYFLPQILRLGIRRCLHLVFAAFLVRMGCYAALRYAASLWVVLPAEVLHGATFAMAWGAGCAYCEQLSPPGLEATTQGLFQGLYFGIGVGIGSLCGGYVYQQHGAQAVYLAACAVILAGWILCSLTQLVVSCLGLELSQKNAYLQVASNLEMNELTHQGPANEDDTLIAVDVS